MPARDASPPPSRASPLAPSRALGLASLLAPSRARRRAWLLATSRARRRALLLAILAVAAALRFAGLGFGLSPPQAGPTLHPLARPDEQYLWNIALGIYAGDPNPHFFMYPSLFPYALALADAAYVAAASLAHGSRAAVEAELLRDPRPLILIDRALVAAIGALTTLLVYRMAGEAFGRRAGLVAAWLLAVAHLHVRDSHFGTTDVPLAALVCLVLLQALRVEARGRRRDYALAGLLAGLAVSTKYSGAILVAPLVAAHCLPRAGRAAGRRTGVARPLVFAVGRDERERQAGCEPNRPPNRSLRLALALALVPVGFLLGSPFAALAWPEFREGIAAQLLAQVEPDWLGIDLGPGWWRHLSFTLWHGLGPPLLLASLVGFGAALLRAPRPTLVLLAFGLPYYLAIGRGQLVFARYMVPLVPLLCAGAAVLVVAAAERLPRGRAAAALGLALLLGLPSLRASLALDRVLAREDSRVFAARWLRARVEPEATLFLVGAVFADPPLFLRDRKAYDPYPWPPRAWAGRVALPSGPRHLRVRNAMDPAFDAIARDPRVDFVVVAESPLVAYGPTASLERRLRGFRRVASFEGVGLHPEMRFDLQDAFYVPLAGARHAIRPGPNLHVYRREARVR